VLALSIKQQQDEKHARRQPEILPGSSNQTTVYQSLSQIEELHDDTIENSATSTDRCVRVCVFDANPAE